MRSTRAGAAEASGRSRQPPLGWHDARGKTYDKDRPMHVIVHIGQPKAGSTAIQMGLWAERENLQKQGILVGPLDRDLSLALHQADVINKIPKLRIKFGTMEAARAHSERHWQQLADTVRATRPALTLLSSEHLMGVSRDLLARLTPLFSRISIVCYVRDPVSRYVSELDQSIRGGTTLPYLDLTGKGINRATNLIRAYHEAAGAENVVVRNFDRRNLKNGDVVVDFFEQVSRLAGRPVAPDHRPQRVNESLCAAASVWLLTLNASYSRRTADPTSVKLRQFLIAHLQTAEALRGLPRLKLSDPVLAEAVRRTIGENASWLNETVLQGQVPLEEGDPSPVQLPEREEMRTRMQDWLLGYLTPETTALVARAVMAYTPAVPAQAPGKKAELASSAR